MANLKGVPGVDIINTGLVQTNVVVRGFNNIFSGSLLTMVDNRYAAVPSLRANVATFIPTDNIDLERIEILRGPASALYGPNCSNGVCHMITKSPLAQEKPFMTTASIGLGFRSKMSDTILISNPIDPATGNIYADYTPLFDYENIGDRMFYTASFRHSGKINDKFGYKILFTYLDGTDWLYDDPFEPARIQLGYQTAEGRVNVGDSIDNIRDHHIQKIGLDLRFDYKLNNSGELIFSGGMTENDGIELTGIGAGQAINWKYYYAQARYLYKGWFAQAFINGSDAGDTYLFRTGDLIIDHSKQYVGQLQHGDELMNKKLNLVYGADGIYTAPDTENTINGKNGTDGKSINISVTSMQLNGESVNKIVVTDAYSGSVLAESKMSINNTLSINANGGSGGNGSVDFGNGGNGGDAGNGGNVTVSGSGAASLKISITNNGGTGGVGGKAKTQSNTQGMNGRNGNKGIFSK